MLIDSHCHLNLLKDVEIDNIIKQAIENNVQYMQTICTKLDDLPVILDIAEKYENVFASVGVHPCEVNGSKQLITTPQIIELTNHPKIIGIGETGLDYYHEPYDKKLQKDSLLHHIEAAATTKLPLIVHTREADDDTIDILTSEMRNNKFPGLIHCFTSSKKLVEKMLDIGLYISMSGIITFKNATDLQEIVKYVPLDRLLIETDAPYLAPTPMRGKQNEPAFVRYVAEKVAELKNITSKEVANVTTNNFKTLFFKFINYLNSSD
ncbi:TatD family hydrolase [Rickettsia endosymbiont of Gonocerus acuteangulatus]|uniref:TatD family hydrolase n=1 Tax=Rickettsia endosymbiont of Gonocerus acuteangulatus TaxID=3066266 RepID=UPI0031330944